ncbi:MAG: DNA translocase FtsK 4TM domain-containing protein, partial [Terriglobales bacterium]
MHPLRPTANRRFNELVGLLLPVSATLLLLALLSFHPSDASLDTAAAALRPANWVGPVGAVIADLLFQSLGIASLLLVVGMVSLATRWFRAPRAQAARLSHVIGLFLSIAAVGTLIAELPRHGLWRGAVPLEGLVGAWSSSALTAAFNPIGAYIITATMLLVGACLATKFSFAATRVWWKQASAEGWLAAVLAWWAAARGQIARPLRALAAWR